MNNQYGGGFTRVLNDINVLQDLGHKVSVLYPSNKRSNGKIASADFTKVLYKGLSYFFPFLTERMKLLMDLNTLFFNRSYRSAISKYLPQNDLCFVHYFNAASPTLFFAKKTAIIFVDHDFSYDLAKQVTKNVIYHEYVHAAERYACKKAKNVIAVSKLDADRIAQEYQIKPLKIKTIPNYIDIEKFSVPESKEAIKSKFGYLKNDFIILFHGKMSTRPNAEALKFIVNNLVPALKKRVPDSKILVVGSDIPDYIKKCGDVSCYSNVENLGVFLKCADVSIVPLTIGGGTRLKILECFASGLPVVSTRKGAEGLKYVNGRHLLISERTVDSFTENITKLKNNQVLMTSLADNGYQLVEQEYSFKMAEAKFRELLKG
jgi:glycosyltransferase involved in cell wall biosynthesis